jgi:hypothetical protein
MKKIILLTLFIFSFVALSEEGRYLGRSPHGLLMGDAYTAIADDEYTLYYNPAILARHKGFSFWPINPSATVTNILKDPDQFSDTGTTTSDFAEQLSGTPVHIGLNATPGFKMGRFGMTAIVNSQSNFKLMNDYTPMLDIDHRFDKGFIAGYAMPLNGDLAVGMSLKYLQRESIYGTYNLIGQTMMDAIAAGEPEKILEGLGQTKGSGWGIDLGFDYVVAAGPNMFTMGLAILDLYTVLHTDSNDLDREVQAQPMQVNFGTSYTLEAMGFGMKLSGDIRNLESQMEFMRRVRLGVELKMSPLISILTGFNARSYSYGIKLDLGIVNTYAGFYEEEIGEKLGQEKSSRGVIYLSLFDFNFDV